MAAISTTLLRQCPSFRPGVAYVLRNALYLQPCARNVAATSLLASRGPGFALPADCGFERLDPDAEPSAAELAAVVDEVYAASTASSAGAMGESDAGVTFAGDGEPLTLTLTLTLTPTLTPTLTLTRRAAAGARDADRDRRAAAGEPYP